MVDVPPTDRIVVPPSIGVRPRLAATAAVGLVGAVAATALVALVFFLNPDQPFGATALLRGVAGYAALLVPVAMLLGAGWIWRRPAALVRSLPWLVAGVLGAAAVLYAWHASALAFALPPGINVRLVKAAAWLGTVALVFFYTALLHTANRRRYGWRSRIGLTVALLVACAASFERRMAFLPVPRGPERPLAAPVGETTQLLFVGIDGASLEWILPLAEQGRLPFLARAAREGASGRLRVPPPAVGAIPWTTIATGRHAYAHGVVGEARWPAPLLGPGAELGLLPRGLGFAQWGVTRTARPLDATARRCLALWDMLERFDLSAGLVGWPLGTPASRRLEFVISEELFEATAGVEEDRLTQPGELAARARLFAAAPKPPGLDDPLLRQSFAGDHWRAAFASQLARERQPAALVVALPGFGQVAEASYGGFAAVQFGGSRNREALAAFANLASYAAALDGLLAELAASLQGPRLLVITSPLGVTRPPLAELRGALRGRPVVVGGRQGPADGFLLLSGEGIAPNTRLADSELIDVVPTTLYGLGLPSARDLDGRVRTAAFTQAVLDRRPLVYVSSFETTTPP